MRLFVLKLERAAEADGPDLNLYFWGPKAPQQYHWEVYHLLLSLVPAVRILWNNSLDLTSVKD
jgi:hypothetical protein